MISLIVLSISLVREKIEHNINLKIFRGTSLDSRKT